MIRIDSNIEKWQLDAERVAGSFNKGVLTRKISIAWGRKSREFAKIQFLTRGRGNWPPLSAKYAARKGTRGAGLLRLTDRMYRSYTERGGENVSRMRRKGSGYEWRFGSKVSYAKYHESGTSKMPQRSVTAFPQAWVNDLMEVQGAETVAFLKRLPFFDSLVGAGFSISGNIGSVGRARV